jgi:hypothetical protein
LLGIHAKAAQTLSGFADQGCWDYPAGIERQGLSPQAKAARTPAGCVVTGGARDAMDRPYL